MHHSKAPSIEGSDERIDNRTEKNMYLYISFQSRPANSLGKRSLCNFLALTVSLLIHAHARIFFKRDKINLHLIFDFESSKYVALSTHNLPKKAESCCRTRKPTE